MKKILLASGCSCTNEHFISDYHPDLDCSWPKWPELLAEKLDMKCINFGHSGAGNEYIYTTLVNQIVRMNPNDIGLVIPAWTQAQRKDIKIRNRWRHLDSVRNYPYKKHQNEHGDIAYRIEESILRYYSLQEICKSKNIPLTQFQVLPIFHGHDWNMKTKKHTDLYFSDITESKNKFKKLLRIIYDNPYFDKIDNNFLGWPTEDFIGGFNIRMDVLLQDQPEGYPQYNISDIDNHPNAKGQIKIAEFLYEKINR